VISAALLHGRITASRQAGLMRRRRARVSASRSGFAGFRFPPDVIMIAVRWYLRYALSYSDVEELLAERGIKVDQARRASGSSSPVLVIGHRQLAEVVWRYGHGWIGRVGLRGLGQAAVAVPVTSFQVVNRPVISRRYSWASNR
jgi:hypothetical protein